MISHSFPISWIKWYRSALHVFSLDQSLSLHTGPSAISVAKISNLRKDYPYQGIPLKIYYDWGTHLLVRCFDQSVLTGLTSHSLWMTSSILRVS